MYLRDLEFLIDPFQKVEINFYAWRNDEEYYFKTIYNEWYKLACMNCSIINIKSYFDIVKKESFISIDVFAHDSPIG